MIPVLAFQWDGEAMVPRHPKLADRHYVIGEVYQLEIREDRSAASHRHYFAAIKETHDNLPDEIAERLPTPEHLRKFALIRKGYRDERTIVCASKAEALRIASFIRPMDDFAIVTTDGATVTAWTAKSQSVRAMPRGEFQKSKDDVLDFLAGLIGTSPDELARHAEQAA